MKELYTLTRKEKNKRSGYRRIKFDRHGKGDPHETLRVDLLFIFRLFANVWHQRYVACSLDCYGKGSLVLCTVSCDAARKNLSSLRDVSL